MRWRARISSSARSSSSPDPGRPYPPALHSSPPPPTGRTVTPSGLPAENADRIDERTGAAFDPDDRRPVRASEGERRAPRDSSRTGSNPLPLEQAREAERSHEVVGGALKAQGAAATPAGDLELVVRSVT